MSFSVRKIKSKEPKRPSRFATVLLGFLKHGHPIVGWYTLWKKRKQEQSKSKKRALALKRVLVVLVSLLIAALVITGIVRAMTGMHVLNLTSIISVAGTKLPHDEEGRINMVILGQGYEQNGKDLTDAIMVASIDPKHTQSALLISLPRDLYFLKTEKMGKGKLNSFYRDYRSYLKYRQGMEPDAASIEAMRELGEEIGRKLGIEIHAVTKINFGAFIDAVDAIGGIDIDVPEDIIDTEFPTENYSYETFEIRAGPQHLDGETALKYARSRSTTSDFSRSARQQQVLRAFVEQAKKGGYITDARFITKMVQSLSQNVESTMSLRELISMAELGKNLDTNRVISMQLNDRNALYDGLIEPGGMLYTPPRSLFDGVSVLLPVSIPEFPVTWKQPQTLVRILQSGRPLYLENPTINVLNNGAKSGMARKLATELRRYGLTVDTIANAALPEKQETSVVFGNTEERSSHAEFLAALLGFVVPENPPPLPEEQRGNLTIIIGSDYTYTPFQHIIHSDEAS